MEETYSTVLTARTPEGLFALELILHVIAAHVFFLFCRKQKLEKELASDLWRVNYNEISLRTRRAGSLRSQVCHPLT